ncbi:hypothetical protein HK102_010389, partial [Quaeritorhiza haematococci]
DWTVKIDARGLSPRTNYFYRFGVASNSTSSLAAGGDVDAEGVEEGGVKQAVFSPIGETKTMPSPDDDTVEKYQMAVVSCAHYAVGYFNAYGNIARRPDVDVVLHLGDYIYEFPSGHYRPEVRKFEPDHETITLQDYRTRHAQYKTDPDLQLLHQLKPTIAVWDDHEFANNAWLDGAGEHQEGKEGTWEDRKRAAVKAYFEYMPVRPFDIKEEVVEGEGEENLAERVSNVRIYRDFQVGKLLDLAMLDTRIIGREKTDTRDAAVINNVNRTLLGKAQEEWLYSTLINSKTRGASWRVIGNQVILSPSFRLNIPLPFRSSSPKSNSSEPQSPDQTQPPPETPSPSTNRTTNSNRSGVILNPDSWEGYPANRARLLDTIQNNKIDNVVVVTGDFHSSYAFDVTRGFGKEGG